MKRTWRIGLSAVLLALLAGAYVTWPGHAPAGQAVLADLDSKAMSGLQTEFNRTSVGLRVILRSLPPDPLVCGGLRSPGNPTASSAEFGGGVRGVGADLAHGLEQTSTSALARLSDRRVRQFWDPNHTLSAVLKKAEEAGKLHPDCCDRKGFLWDLTAAYAPNAQ
jgi:hypothetical protein